MTRSMITVLAAVAGLAISTSPASAGMIFGGPTTPNTEGLGAFTGSIVVTPNGANAATLTITLTNEATTSAGGKITAVVFNNPNDLITGATLNPNPPAAPGENFRLFPSPNPVAGAVNGAPFGDFDFVLTTDPSPGASSFEGGGSPNRGLFIGETGVFVIDLTGTGVGSLTQEDFENALSSGNAGQGNQAIVVRFRGFDNGGSDKVVAQPQGNPIPEPASLVLAATAVGLSAARRLRRRSAAA